MAIQSGYDANVAFCVFVKTRMSRLCICEKLECLGYHLNNYFF